MREGTLLTTWFTRTGHGHDLGVLAVVNMEWLVRSEVWDMGYGVSLRSCGQFSPHLLVPSLHVVCYRGPVPLLDLDALCVKEGGRN